MREPLFRMMSVGLLLAGFALIWYGYGWLGCGAILCAGALAGAAYAAGEQGGLKVGLIFIGFLLLLGGGYLIFSGRALAGILVTLLAALPWCWPPSWNRFFAFACFAFWTFGVALLFRGEALIGALLLAGSLVPWYARERVAGRRFVLSLSLLAEVVAVCGAAAAMAHHYMVTGAILLALFFVSRIWDDYLLVRRGHALSRPESPLSFRGYLNLQSNEARRFRNQGRDR